MLPRAARTFVGCSWPHVVNVSATRRASDRESNLRRNPSANSSKGRVTKLLRNTRKKSRVTRFRSHCLEGFRDKSDLTKVANVPRRCFADYPSSDSLAVAKTWSLPALMSRSILKRGPEPKPHCRIALRDVLNGIPDYSITACEYCKYVNNPIRAWFGR